MPELFKPIPKGVNGTLFKKGEQIVATIHCACKKQNCQAEPHKGKPECSSSEDGYAVFGQSTMDSGDKYGPPPGWSEDGRCDECVKANSAEMGGADVSGGADTSGSAT